MKIINLSVNKKKGDEDDIESSTSISKMHML